MTATPALFPFKHDWATPFQITRTYATDVQTADDGSEIRASLRSEPAISFGIDLQFGNEAGAGRLLATWRGATRPLYYYAPLWCDVTELTDPVAAGDAIITLDTTDRPFFAAPGFVMFWRSEANAEVVAFSGSDDTMLLLDAGTVNSYAVAGTKVVPVRPMWLEVPVALTWQNGVLAKASLRFSDAIPQAGLSLDDTAATPLVDSVLIYVDSWGVGAGENHVGRGEFIARAVAFDAGGIPIPSAEFSWTNDFADVDSLLVPSIGGRTAKVVANDASSTITATCGAVSHTIGAS